MLALALLIAASSGWEAKVHFTHDPPRKSGGSDGAIHLSRGRVRLEEPTPGGATVALFDGAKLLLLFPDRKEYLELPKTDAPLATVPPLSLRGTKAVGEERIDGVPCTIYERTVETRAGRIHQRLWVPDERRFFFFLRQVTQTDRGATRADLSEIRAIAQPDRLFRVPKGYRRK